LPTYFLDNKYTRKVYAKYLAEIEHLDRQVGQALEALAKTGQAKNTLVIFTSEQGAPFPGGKWTNWNTGVRTAFVVRWLGVVTPSRRTEALIQYADVLPTLIDASGGTVHKSQFDGTIFLPVLEGSRDERREYAYFIHNNVPECPSSIRAITNGTHNYIRNLKPESLYIEKHVFGHYNEKPYLSTWFYKATIDEHARAMVSRFMRWPAEELYNLEENPYELENQPDDPQLKEIKNRLSEELDSWMKRPDDPCAALNSWKMYKDNGGYKDVPRSVQSPLK
jgi:uncharacterized sulfatase